jgi:hypothetical protein
MTGNNTVPTTVQQKLDCLLERTAVFESVAQIVADHDCILRGPQKTDGLIADMQRVQADVETLKAAVQEIKKSARETQGEIKKVLWSLGIPFLLFCAGFLWSLLNHWVTIVVGH